MDATVFSRMAVPLAERAKKDVAKISHWKSSIPLEYNERKSKKITTINWWIHRKKVSLTPQKKEGILTQRVDHYYQITGF